MWIGIGNIIPIIKRPIGGGTPPPVGDFIITEASPLTGPGVEYVLSEAGDNLVKE